MFNVTPVVQKLFSGVTLWQQVYILPGYLFHEVFSRELGYFECPKNFEENLKNERDKFLKIMGNFLKVHRKNK